MRLPPKHPKGTDCPQMADVLRTLLVYRRDAFDAGMLPLCYGKSLLEGKVD